MQIKTLEVSGFKSFVDRVNLQFKPGITALVGPNGCGKSNIIDALRWIMGEHNARNLRGTRMEDLIFNGSDTRKPTGMAEVTLVMANGNGKHAVLGSASELMITRRLFRSGESEYYINKVPCRLKDVVELFLDSGIGTRSYAIMEQGKVDFILSLKPDERRILIEEAAGISKYRARKKEALSKVQSTKDNLLRLRDILNEIDQQMRGLELQVKRLKRYRGIKEEIRDIDLLLASDQRRTLKGEEARALLEISSYRDEKIMVATQLHATESRLEQSRLSLTELLKGIAQLQQRSFQLKNQIQNEENTLQFNERELQNTRDLIAKNTAVVIDLKNEGDHIDLDILNLEGEQSGIREEITRLQEQFQTASGRLAETRETLRRAQESIELERSELLRIAYEKTEIKNAMLLNRRLQHDVASKLQKLAAERQNCHGCLASLEQESRILEKQLHEMITQREYKEKQIEDVRQDLDSLQQALHEKESAYSELRDRIGALRARLSSLQELHGNLEGFADGVRTVMNAAADDGGALHGVVGLLADKIQTAPEFERAVESALDAKIQSILVNTHHESLRVIEHLKSCSGGRVSCLPVGPSCRTPAASIPPECTPLINLVTAGADVQASVANLLYGTVLVDDLGRALEIHSSFPEMLTLVTRDGDVLEPNGVMTGGSTAVSGSGILRRNREIKELAKSLELLESELVQLQAVREQAQLLVQQARQQLESLLGEKQQLDLELVQKKTTADQSDRQLLVEKEKARLISHDEAESSSAFQQYQTELDQFIAREASIQHADAEKQHILDELRCLQDSLARELERAESSHTELRIQLASALQKRENVAGNLQRLVDQRVSLHVRRDAVDLESRQLQERTVVLDADRERARSQIVQLLEHSRSADDQTAAEQSTVQGLEQTVAADEGNLRELRQRQEELDPKIHAVELNLSSLAVHLGHLDREMSEKYVLTPADLPAAPDPQQFNEQEMRDRLETLKKRLENIGDVNLGAAREYEELESRHQFLCSQQDDLQKSIDSLQQVIAKINRITRQKFMDTFTEINRHFEELFPILFNGGKAHMKLTDESDLLETGIEIYSQPPGKKLQSLDLLSGGERALTVIALMFAIFLTKPSPFCLMDEIDAPLDDSNIGKFVAHLQKMAQNSQFIMVTHNKLSMQAADSLYGVTMEERGISRVVSVELN